MSQFKRGDQIAYIPMHAENNIDHPDVELGFVTSVRDDTIFCRYWRHRNYPLSLRTLANSEGTPVQCLVSFVSVLQSRVDKLLETM